MASHAELVPDQSCEGDPFLHIGRGGCHSPLVRGNSGSRLQSQGKPSMVLRSSGDVAGLVREPPGVFPPAAQPLSLAEPAQSQPPGRLDL